MEHFDYLFAAYSIIFAALAIYVVFIWRRQARLEVEVRAMEARLKNLRQTAEPPRAAASSKK